MNRMSGKKDFIDALNYARKKVPNIRISTDIIVGFPGETEKDFNESLELIQENKVNVLNISRFGKRRGTKAATMPGQLEEKDKKKRTRILSEKSRKLFLEENKKMLGFKGKALVSEKADKNGFVARTNNYSPVIVNSKFGSFVDIEITSVYSHFFKGKIIA
jgi:tRNA A37 methylthiotransferase MiaB